MNQPINTDVVIVGAGPTGLALGCQLARHGIDFVIADRNPGVTPFSKAVGVHARTLEIYEQMGLAEAALVQGTVAGKVRLLAGGRQRGEFDLSEIGADLSPYPYLLLLEQSKNEQLLYSMLQAQGHDVLWNTEFQALQQEGGGVTAELRLPNGSIQTVAASYLVGCDGPRSPVRNALDLKFEGSTFERVFYVADALIDWEFSHEALHICLAPNSFVLFFPLQGENRYRIVGVMPEGIATDPGDILYEEIETRIKQESGLTLDIHDVEWFSSYKVHTRHVESFSRGRCFLAGDAAHIHSPVGAQGMNTGIQDGYNLAWKLALTLKGVADERLLETYNEERLANAITLTETTDRAFNFVAGKQWYFDVLRANVLPPLLSGMLSLDRVKQVVFPRLSQIGISYRNHSLADHKDDDAFKVKAGDRMPYFRVDGKSVYDSLREPKFHVLSFAGAEQGAAALVPEDVKARYRDLLDFVTVPFSGVVQEVFGTDEPFLVLLRPDNYIATLCACGTAERVERYLKEHVDSAGP